MKSSHKIAIVSAVAIVLIVFTVYLQMEKPKTGSPGTPAASGTPGTAEVDPHAAPTGSGVSTDELVNRWKSMDQPGTLASGGASGGATTQPSSMSAAATTQPSAMGDETVKPRTSDIFASTPGDHRLTGTSYGSPSESLTTPSTYKVASGDTLMSIAQTKLGSSARWRDLAAANPLVDPARLKIGQVIRLPDAKSEPLASSSTTTTPPAVGAKNRVTISPETSGTYTVRSGDTLASIARASYHNADLWSVIYKANKSTIGAKPSQLREGMKLTIPAVKPEK